METTPRWALARMYARPYCPPRRSSCFFCDDTVHIACLECGVYQCALHASVLCPSICVALRKWRVQFTATLACIVLAFALDDHCAVDKLLLVDEVRPKVVIRGKEFFVCSCLFNIASADFLAICADVASIEGGSWVCVRMFVR